MMSQSRFDAIFKGVKGVAQKVYQAVPIKDAWTPTQIASELARLGVQMEFRTVGHCLRTLVNAGLVCEIGRATYRREGVRPEPASHPASQPAHPTPAALPPAPPSPATVKDTTMVKSPNKAAAAAAPKKTAPIDRLGELAQRTATLAGLLKELAADISDAAIDIQAQIEASDDDCQKLRQLQALLKSIGADSVTA